LRRLRGLQLLPNLNFSQPQKTANEAAYRRCVAFAARLSVVESGPSLPAGRKMFKPPKSARITF
jgi:hypothetical protein